MPEAALVQSIALKDETTATDFKFLHFYNELYGQIFKFNYGYSN
jgi:hypothetical protein